jgi:hypothetical protein
MTKASAVPSCSGSRWDRGHPPDPHTTRRRVRNGRFPSRPGSAYMGTFTPEPVPMPGVRVHGAGRGPRLPLRRYWRRLSCLFLGSAHIVQNALSLLVDKACHQLLRYAKDECPGKDLGRSVKCGEARDEPSVH